MAIGDDLQILLGLVPTRDRAGIQRGTMATEAAGAAARADGNAEGQALTRQGFDFARAAPPPVQLPPGMGEEPDAANMPIAGGAPAQFVIPGSTGTSAAPTPVPRERVVAASPAAAPSPAVIRNSDVMMAAIKQQQQQAKMQQLFSSIGLIANGLFNRDPSSANATRQGLAEGLGGGGGRGGVSDLATLKTMLDMRGKEDEAIANKATRQRLIDYAVKTEGWTPEDAAAKVDAGVLDEFMKPEALLKKEEVKRTQQVRDMLGPNAATYAKAIGMDEAAFRAMVHEKPSDAIALLTPETMAKARKLQLENTNLSSAQAAQRAEIEAILGDPEAAKDPAGTMARVRSIMNPAAAEKGLVTRAENIEKRGEPERIEIFKKYMTEERKEGNAAEAYLNTSAQAIGDAWSPTSTVGTFSNLRRDIARAYATVTGGDTPDLNDTAKLDSALKQAATTSLKALGGNDTDRDREWAAMIGGKTELANNELRGVAILNEKAYRHKLEKSNELRREYAEHDPKSNVGLLPPHKMPPASKLLMADIYAPEERHKPRNTQLRTEIERYAQQLKANPTAENLRDYKKVEAKFNREYGADMAREYLQREANRRP